MAAAMPRATAPLTAFLASGRLTVMTATPSLTSVSTGSDIRCSSFSRLRGRLQPLRITGESELSGARVLSLAGRVARHLADQRHGPGQLVARQAGAQEGAERGEVKGLAVAELDDRGHRLPVLLVGNADHEAVVDRWMGLDRGLAFFRIDLLAAGIDAVRATAEQRDPAIGLDPRPVARY